MSMITASAPGKLFITGEYAVLDKAPALLTAVDVRAICRLRPSGSATWRIHTPPIASAPALFTLRDGLPCWEGEPVALLDAAWGALSEQDRQTLEGRGWNISLDTSAFFLKDRKLGLGSSAAALTALMGGLWKAARTDDGQWPAEPEAFDALHSAHRAWQGGGSGADIAVALAGGTLLYRREPRIAAPVALPDTLEILAVWTGQPASTRGFLRRLAEFQDASPEVFRERFSVLEREAEEAALAASNGDAASFLEAFVDSGAALRALGESAQLNIWSEPHERIGGLVAEAGGLYKPSGAGGGDVGLAILRTGDATHLEGLKSALSSAGFNILPLRFGARGLHVVSE